MPKEDYSLLDRPEILRFLFYPRPDWNMGLSGKSTFTFSIPIETDITVGGIFHAASHIAPNILFFHGNGEIASEYNEIAPFYTERGYNFIPVDYRGYGRSSGTPTLTAMMNDCHTIFAYVKTWLKENGYGGPLVVMGRSLGSAAAIAVAYYSQDEIDGLIIESGFAYMGPLLALMGIHMQQCGLDEEDGPRNIEKIKSIYKPTLIIHAEYDHIIAVSEGRALYGACAAKDKKLLIIPGANHNNIFFAGMKDYLQAIAWLVDRLEKGDE